MLAEATVLGVVALDALSAPGRALLDDPDRVVAALRATLPEPVDHVLLQADLTAVAPGPLETELARELELVAEVESAGGATVYRFTEATIRRALDAGRTAADLHELLATRSATPVPQGLTYLVDDVARRHGRLRGGAAASFLRSDDEVLIAEVLAHPDTGRAGAAPHRADRAVSPLPLVELLDGLRAAGFSPGRGGHRRRGARPDRPRPAHRPAPAPAPAAAPPRAGRRAAGRAGVPDAGRRRAGRGAARAPRPSPPTARTLDLLRSAAASRPQRLDRVRRRARRGGRARAGAGERRRRGGRGPGRGGRRRAPGAAAPDHRASPWWT